MSEYLAIAGSIPMTGTVAVALAMLVLGIGLLFRQILRSRFLRQTTGRLVGWERGNDAVISFPGDDGSEHRFVTTVLAAARPGMGIGQPFPTPVLYDARHPGRARLGRISYLWIAPFVWLAIGSGTLLLARHASILDRMRGRIARIDMFDVLGVIGLVMTISGTATLIRRILFFRRSHRTTGTFVRWKEERRFDPRGRSTIWRSAVVSFHAPDGSVHEVVSDWASGTKSTVPMGHSFPVRYDPQDPQDAYIATVGNLWAKPLVFLLIGGVLFYVFGLGQLL